MNNPTEPNRRTDNTGPLLAIVVVVILVVVALAVVFFNSNNPAIEPTATTNSTAIDTPFPTSTEADDDSETTEEFPLEPVASETSTGN